MSLIMRHNSVYGSTYLSEKFLEKPFFLDGEGISGEPEEGKPWKLSFNPVSLNVYDNTNLDDLVTYLMHVRQYNCFYNYALHSEFDAILIVFSKIFDRIKVEINLEMPSSLDTIMFAYNLLSIMTDMVLRFHSVLRYQKSVEQLNATIMCFYEFKLNLINDRKNNPAKYAQSGRSFFLLLSILTNLIFHLSDASYIIEQNDLKSLNRIIVSSSSSNRFLPDLVPEQIEDEYFTSSLINIQIYGDYIRIVRYTQTSETDFDLLKNELSDRASDLEIFNYCNEDSIIDSKNLVNYKAFEHINTSTSENIDYCNIADHFNTCFWKIKKAKNEQNEYRLLKPEETRFIFQFTIRILSSLKKIPQGNSNHEKLIHDNLELFGKILNYLRFSEIDAAISLKTALILSKTLEELLTDPPVRSFIHRMPSEIMLVITRITSFLGIREMCAPLLKIAIVYKIEFSITDLKPIENVCQIPKIRRGKWKNIILGNTTSANGDQFFNRDECPVCYNKQQTEDSCHLVCRHTLCSSCTKTISDKNKLARCPLCRNPFFEYLPSKNLADICLEQLQ